MQKRKADQAGDIRGHAERDSSSLQKSLITVRLEFAGNVRGSEVKDLLV